MTLVELVREYQEASKTQDDARFSAACVALLDYQLPATETPAPNYTPPPTSNTADASDGSIRDRAAWTAMCERRKAETPAPDAMPEIHAGDVVKASNYARPVEMEHQHTVDWFNERPFLVESVQRVIWRRQEAQP